MQPPVADSCKSGYETPPLYNAVYFLPPEQLSAFQGLQSVRPSMRRLISWPHSDTGCCNRWKGIASLNSQIINQFPGIQPRNSSKVKLQRRLRHAAMVQACWRRSRAWQESGTPAGQPQTSIQPKLPPPLPPKEYSAIDNRNSHCDHIKDLSRVGTSVNVSEPPFLVIGCPCHRPAMRFFCRDGWTTQGMSTGASRMSPTLAFWFDFIDYNCVISGFRRCVNEIPGLLRCYAAYVGSYRRFDRSHHQGSSLTSEDGTDTFSRNVGNYQSVLSHIQKERGSLTVIGRTTWSTR